MIDDAVVRKTSPVTRLADRTRAIRSAVQELIWPVTTSTLTTVVVFLPLGLLQGVVGQFFAALATTLTVAVLVSLALALTIIPLLAEQFVTEHDVAATPRGPLARAQATLDSLGPRYERALTAVLQHTRRIVIAALALVAVGWGLWQVVETGFLPEMDEGAFVLDYFTPGGTALTETDREVGIAERILAATPEIEGTSRRTGAELGLFATAQNTGDIVARLGAAGQALTRYLRRHRRRPRPDHRRRAAPPHRVRPNPVGRDQRSGGRREAIEVKLFGERLDSLEACAAARASLDSIDGLEDLYNGVSEPSPELLMHVNQAEAGRARTHTAGWRRRQRALLGTTAGEVRRE